MEIMDTGEIRAAVVQVSFGRFPRVDEKLVQILRAQCRKEEDAAMTTPQKKQAKKKRAEMRRPLSEQNVAALLSALQQTRATQAELVQALRIEQRKLRAGDRTLAAKHAILAVGRGMRVGFRYVDTAAGWLVTRPVALVRSVLERRAAQAGKPSKVVGSTAR